MCYYVVSGCPRPIRASWFVELEAIVVGDVGTGAPWFLTGWAEGTEVEFMIDTGCQVTILVTSVFERMPPAIGIDRLIPADGPRELCMSVVIPGLQCDMTLVIPSIGSEGLLGPEALQSCLPHQLDLRMGQQWADGQSTLQLHQQWQAVQASAFTEGSVVVPPDSEIVAPVSIRSPAGNPPGRCSLIEPGTTITENYVVLVGHPLVDTLNWSAEVLLINTGSDVVVLPRSRVLVMWCRCLQLLLRGPCRLNRRLHRLGPFLHTSRKS